MYIIASMLFSKEIIYDIVCPYGSLFMMFYSSWAWEEKSQIVNIIVLRQVVFPKLLFSIFY